VAAREGEASLRGEGSDDRFSRAPQGGPTLFEQSGAGERSETAARRGPNGSSRELGRSKRPSDPVAALSDRRLV